MAIAYAQSTAVDSGVVSSASLAFPSNNTANGLITAGIRLSTTGATITSLTDTNANTYKLVFSVVNSSQGIQNFLYYAEGIAAGANTVAIVLSSASTIRWSIHEYTGLLTTGSLDTFASTTGSSTTPTSPTVTNAGVNQLLFGWGTVISSNVWTAGTNYTQRESIAGRFASEDRIVAASGSFNAPANIDVSNAWTMGIATFLSTAIATVTGNLSMPIYRTRLRSY